MVGFDDILRVNRGGYGVRGNTFKKSKTKSNLKNKKKNGSKNISPFGFMTDNLLNEKKENLGFNLRINAPLNSSSFLRPFNSNLYNKNIYNKKHPLKINKENYFTVKNSLVLNQAKKPITRNNFFNSPSMESHNPFMNSSRGGNPFYRKDIITPLMNKSKYLPNKIERNKYKNKNYAELKRKFPNMPPWDDWDMDGSPNIIDCKPLDPSKDGFFGDLIDKVKGAFTSKDSAGQDTQDKEETARAEKEIKSLAQAIPKEEGLQKEKEHYEKIAKKYKGAPKEMQYEYKAEERKREKEEEKEKPEKDVKEAKVEAERARLGYMESKEQVRHFKRGKEKARERALPERRMEEVQRDIELRKLQNIINLEGEKLQDIKEKGKKEREHEKKVREEKEHTSEIKRQQREKEKSKLTPPSKLKITAGELFGFRPDRPRDGYIESKTLTENDNPKRLYFDTLSGRDEILKEEKRRIKEAYKKGDINYPKKEAYLSEVYKKQQEPEFKKFDTKRILTIKDENIRNPILKGLVKASGLGEYTETITKGKGKKKTQSTKSAPGGFLNPLLGSKGFILGKDIKRSARKGSVRYELFGGGVVFTPPKLGSVYRKMGKMRGRPRASYKPKFHPVTGKVLPPMGIYEYRKLVAGIKEQRKIKRQQDIDRIHQLEQQVEMKQRLALAQRGMSPEDVERARIVMETRRASPIAAQQMEQQLTNQQLIAEGYAPQIPQGQEMYIPAEQVPEMPQQQAPTSFLGKLGGFVSGIGKMAMKGLKPQQQSPQQQTYYQIPQSPQQKMKRRYRTPTSFSTAEVPETIQTINPMEGNQLHPEMLDNTPEQQQTPVQAAFGQGVIDTSVRGTRSGEAWLQRGVPRQRMRRMPDRYLIKQNPYVWETNRI